MSGLCPRCGGTGYDPADDRPIARGDMQFDPRGEVRWKGEVIHLSPAKRMLVFTVLKADGRAVSRETLADRMGYEGDDPRGLVAVHLTQLRKRIDLPITNVSGVGLRWAA